MLFMKDSDILSQMSEKRSRLLELMGQEPQAVVLFAGAMRFDDVSKMYVSGDYSDRDENSGLISAGRDRVLAAKGIYRFFPSILFVTTSKTRDEKKPTYASVMKRELMEFGVPESSILEENESVDTVGCTKAVMRLIDDHDWKRIVLLSAAFHVPRMKAVLERLECFADDEDERLFLGSMANKIHEGVIQVSIMASDDVVQETDPEYMKSLDIVKKSPEYKEKLAAELGGAKRILEGGEYNGYRLPIVTVS
jgi:hypothetical protein